MSEDVTSKAGGNRMLGIFRVAGNAAGGLAKSAGNRLDQAARSARTARAISDLEERVSAFRRERKIGKGTLRATHVAAYRGFVAGDVARVRVRVVEEPVVPSTTELVADPQVVRSNLRRFFALALPGVRLSIRLGDAQTEVVSDRHGFATAVLPASSLTPGWHDYTCVTVPDDPDEPPTQVTGQVLVQGPGALSVVSDIDDTVLRTGLTEGFVAVRNTLMSSAEARRAIPGMSALYQALNEGVASAHPPAFYYVSTGPWNLYEMLTGFLRFRGFPKGVLFLTDWGPQERYVMRSGKEHKRLTLHRLFAAHPDTSFVLVGDSGQHDADVYLEVARDFPGRVRAIVILDVGEHLAERADELRRLSVELRAGDINFFFAEDAREAARVLADADLIDPGAVQRVREAYLAEADD